MKTNTNIELSALIQILEAKGISYEMTGETTKLIWCGETPVGIDTFFGIDLLIKIAPGIWVKYLVRGMENGCANEYWFNQRYNANIGSVLKSWKTKCKVHDTLLKMTGVSLTGC